MNFLITLLGWAAWNFFELKEAKDAYDEKDQPFGLKTFCRKKWDNWIWTLLCAAILYIIGIRGLGMALVQSFDEKLQWSDLYYFGTGFFSEAVSYAYRRWVKKSNLAEK